MVIFHIFALITDSAPEKSRKPSTTAATVLIVSVLDSSAAKKVRIMKLAPRKDQLIVRMQKCQ